MAGSVSTGFTAVPGTVRPGRLVMAGDQDYNCPRVGREWCVSECHSASAAANRMA
jgi:hypothetical protein